jgi:hypothetical protein
VLVDHAARGRYHDWLRQRIRELQTVWAIEPAVVKSAAEAFARGQRALGDGDVHRAMSELAATCRIFPVIDYEANLAWARYRVQVASGRGSRGVRAGREQDGRGAAARAPPVATRARRTGVAVCCIQRRRVRTLAPAHRTRDRSDRAGRSAARAAARHAALTACQTDREHSRYSRGVRDIEDRLHAARPGTIEAELVAIALESTGAEHGALFVWDKDAGGLALVHHVVNGVTVTPRLVKHDGPKAGIALHVFDEASLPVSGYVARPTLHAVPDRHRLDRGLADPVPAPADRRAHGLDA